MTALAAAVGGGLGAVVPASAASASVAPARTDCARPGSVLVPVPWAQQMLAPQRVWPFTEGAGATVAVLDSGVDATQPQLRGAVLKGADFLHPSGAAPGTVDCHGHGTQVASIIAARTSAESGFHGVAPGATILPVTVSEKEIVEKRPTGHSVAPRELAKAIRWAVDKGAHVINMSLVVYQDEASVRSAVAYAVAKDVVVVAAVGNLGGAGEPNPVPYPAAYDGVIGVGALNQDGTRWLKSQRGPYVDVMAPGGAVTAATRVRGHVEVEGTSFAAPFVSGIAALLRGREPHTKAAEIARRIIATANPAAGGRAEYGYGAADPYRAVTEMVESAAPRPLSKLASPVRDRAAEARRAHRAKLQLIAVSVAIGLVAVVALVVFGAAVLPQGRRRGWRPLKAAQPTPPQTEDSPGAGPTFRV